MEHEGKYKVQSIQTSCKKQTYVLPGRRSKKVLVKESQGKVLLNNVSIYIMFLFESRFDTKVLTVTTSK